MGFISDLFNLKTSPEPVSAEKAKSKKHLTAYGDVLGDGAMQLSFTFPVEASPEAREAAKQYVEKMGLTNVFVAHMEAMGEGLSYFVVYAHAKHSIDFTKVKVKKAEFERMSFEESRAFANQHLPRELVIVGATTGNDAHTVGLDAIMNMKGYLGDYGLERYPFFKVHNLRSQVSHESLIGQIKRLKADVVLVSKIVTQRDQYLKELKDLSSQLNDDKSLPKNLIKIMGGPKMTHAEATKLGYDAGFGTGTLPSEVASFILQNFVKRS